MTNGVAYTIDELDAYKKKVLEYLVKTAGGTFAAGCKYANIPFSTAYAWRKDDPKWDEDVIAARNASDELGGDFAESKLMEAINNNELTGVIFYLKTKHKNRGYIERVEQNHGGQKDNPVVHTLADSDKAALDHYFKTRGKND